MYAYKSSRKNTQCNPEICRPKIQFFPGDGDADIDPITI